MLGQQQAETLLTQVLGYSKADETEVLIRAQDAALTRYANSIIHQNVAETDVLVTVRAVAGKRVGTASTNDLSAEALARVAEQALDHARRQPEDPDFPGLPEPRPIQPVQAFDDATAGYSPVARARAVGTICALAGEHSLSAAGAFRTGTHELAIANSHGLLAYHAGTSADLQAVMTGTDGSGRARGSSVRVQEIDAEAIGREVVAKTLRAQDPRPLEPGDYTVVLDPYATADLINWLNFSGVSAETVQDGRSWMNDRIGKQVMNSLISIWDDARDPRGSPQPFDFEGMPRQPVMIVEQGVVRSPVYDRYTAHKEGRETTGHASPPEMRGPMATNLFLGTGDAALGDLIKATPRGLYITSFWYTRLVHPRDCVITGMTRDGVLMIENGELTHAVKNLRFTQSYVQALASTQALGRDLKTLIDEGGGAVCVPAIKIERFTFTGMTV